MANTTATVRSPSYYVKKRLWLNKPAMAGLVIILVAGIMAVLGYLIMPDASPNANHSIVQLQTKPPGFTVPMLRLKNPNQTAGQGIFHKWLFGQETAYLSRGV